MIINVLGIFHLIHSPFLIIFPFLIQNFTSDILYLIYFFLNMYLYTFIEGECPISYACKKIKDNKYCAGNNITHYPEMEFLFANKEYINCYFGVMTTLYILTLCFIIRRTNLPIYPFSVPFLFLFAYFLSIRKILVIKSRANLVLFQDATKCILFFTIALLAIRL